MYQIGIFADNEAIRPIMDGELFYFYGKPLCGESSSRILLEQEVRFMCSMMYHAGKDAFSDAVGHSMVDDLKEYANNYYTDK